MANQEYGSRESDVRYTSQRAIPFHALDVADALPDYCRMQAGLVDNKDSAHPIAYGLAERSFRLKDIAAHIAGAHGLEGANLTRMLTTSDFGSTLATTMHRMLGISFNREAADHRMLRRDLELKNLKPAELPTIDVPTPELLPGNSGPRLFPIFHIETGGTATPKIYSTRILISRELMISADPSLFALLSDQLAGAAVRIEQELLAGVIDDDPTLSDGDTLFVTGNTTSAATGTPNTTLLDEAYGILRTQSTPAGEKGNVAARFLLAPPAKVDTCQALVASLANGTEQFLRATTNSWLSGAHSYLIASPDETPTFIRSFPEIYGGEPEIERYTPVEYNSEGQAQYYDGVSLIFRHAIGIDAATRAGVAKLAAS
jgi:hypothetical protein